jgi:thiamine pyrophosphate-dependent acetolactate synthase large subunit-like protein
MHGGAGAQGATEKPGGNGRSGDGQGSAASVRDASFDVLRRLGLTKIFSNPGSTEVPFLAGLPDDLEFVLALHEASVVGMATGWALGSGEPAFVLLHTTAGLGNAVGALATARVNRAPLVVAVGQQDRRHLAHEPFLTGRLEGLAGEYPVWVDQPARAQDVPGALFRAYYEARTGRGPALVIVPMDDWLAPAPEPHDAVGPERLVESRAAEPGAVEELAALVDGAGSPALVVGAGADSPECWSALVRLAERLSCPVWQEPFGARAGFPQDHRLFAGHLPADRGRLRAVLEPHDMLLVVGAPVFRQYPYAEGPLAPPGTRVALVTDDGAEAHRSPTELTVLADLAGTCAALAERVAERSGGGTEPRRAAPEPLAPPSGGRPLRAAHVLDALAERLPRNAVVVEETPSSRPELHARLPAREPMGFVSAAMGGLGFALPAAIGLRMALPERPVVAVVGDGSSLYAIQSLWSAAQYGAGALFVVLANGRYAVMDRLAERTGKSGPWPAFDGIQVAAMARALGCPAARVEEHGELLAQLDELVPRLGSGTEPFLLEVAVEPDAQFEP